MSERVILKLQVLTTRAAQSNNTRSVNVPRSYLSVCGQGRALCRGGVADISLVAPQSAGALPVVTVLPLVTA